MMQRFSQRTDWNLEETAYARALQRLKASGMPILDLTASNPTACGFEYDGAGILRELSGPGCLEYQPDPHGLAVARTAVVDYYAAGQPTRIPSEQIFLTTSTSEAYSYLFRLHCDSGSEVMIAQPSYPLFDFLADLDDVHLVPYPLFYDHGWHIDIATLKERVTSRTRAIVVVHPNNPTGHFTTPEERSTLEHICEEYGLALIVDEVFLDYGIDPVGAGSQLSFARGAHPVLTYVLSGLSKMAGLPQMKAAWIAALGPIPTLQAAIARLEMIADTFLSMNAPVQHAMPYLLAHCGDVQRQIRQRVSENLKEVDRQLVQASSVSRLQVQGGWYVVLRVPALMGGDELAIRLMEREGVVVHPGHFYGFDGDGWIVLSLLPPALEFSGGVSRLLAMIE